MTITLYNTLTRKKEPLTPLDPANVSMYVCGPTVYARPHIGNARSVVVYDVLFRLLRHVYGEQHVKYVRNITDVDDKINAAALERGITIQQLTQEVTAQFREDMSALNCLSPTIEPTATGHIAAMITMIEQLITNGNAYVAQGHVLFDVMSAQQSEGQEASTERASEPSAANGALTSEASRPQQGQTDYHYGMLSGRRAEEQEAGARIAVESYKKNPGDFVLWKPASEKDDASSKFESPWGVGRPGWHIECSAMSTLHLGHDFDIHGGGADLMFPHHENEIAQARCAHPHSEYARMWVHNGFLTVDGEKMSKSLGNFITVKDLLDQGVHGEVIRFALLSTHYRKPLDWTDKLLNEREDNLNYLCELMYQKVPLRTAPLYTIYNDNEEYQSYVRPFFYALYNDLNVSGARDVMFDMVSRCELELKLLLFPESGASAERFNFLLAALQRMTSFLGIASYEYFQFTQEKRRLPNEKIEEVQQKINARLSARKAKNWAESDRIRDELKAQGIILEDRPDGTTDWRRA